MVNHGKPASSIEHIGPIGIFRIFKIMSKNVNIGLKFNIINKIKSRLPEQRRRIIIFPGIELEHWLSENQKKKKKL